MNRMQHFSNKGDIHEITCILPQGSSLCLALRPYKEQLAGFLSGLLGVLTQPAGVLTQLIVFLKNDSTYPETQRIKR